MSNYVWNKVICDKDILEKYFIDYNPFGDGNLLDKPYITFNKLFDIKTLDEYATKLGVHIYYGDGFSYKRLENNKYEILFCTKWKYPISAIKKVLTLSHNIEWYAVEENCIYVSKFYWNNGIKENVMVIDDEYEKWLDKLDSIGVVYRYSDDMLDEFMRLESVAAQMKREPKETEKEQDTKMEERSINLRTR